MCTLPPSRTIRKKEAKQGPKRQIVCARLGCFPFPLFFLYIHSESSPAHASMRQSMRSFQQPIVPIHGSRHPSQRSHTYTSPPGPKPRTTTTTKLLPPNPPQFIPFSRFTSLSLTYHFLFRAMSSRMRSCFVGGAAGGASTTGLGSSFLGSGESTVMGFPAMLAFHLVLAVVGMYMWCVYEFLSMPPMPVSYTCRRQLCYALGLELLAGLLPLLLLLPLKILF